MGALAALANKLHKSRMNGPEWTDARAGDGARQEWLWLGASFLLFLLLGPFSTVAVLAGLASLVPPEARIDEPPGSC